jgi:glycosyltransferase involved in cell wall biosynthesis
MKQNYILITPCKNEGEHLPALIKSIIEQTVQPVIWIIVDDGSTDNTPSVIAQYSEKYEWIHSLKLSEIKKRDIGLHLAGVMNRGFNTAIEYCNQKAIEYMYLGNVDGDLVLDRTFFENLMIQFENDPELGVASGGTDYMIDGKILRVKTSADEPSGGHMLIRKKCFDDCGGIPISYASDGVLKVKARLHGWKTKRFEENRAIEARDVNSAEGYWKGYTVKGKTSYYINHNPIHVMANIGKYSIRYPYYIGIPYFIGYFNCLLHNHERINDPEIQFYFHEKWKEVLKKRIGKN